MPNGPSHRAPPLLYLRLGLPKNEREITGAFFSGCVHGSAYRLLVGVSCDGTIQSAEQIVGREIGLGIVAKRFQQGVCEY